MHKLHLRWVGTIATTIFLVVIVISTVRAISPSPWLTSALSLVKQADVQGLPENMNSSGNIDCQKENNSSCSIPTAYGSATFSSTAYINGSAGFLPVFS